MNAALVSSVKMDYCTPQEVFDQLDAEFHFTLDAAATDKSAKCQNYYTPETDGLKSPWNLAGGALYSVILHTGGRLGNGCKKPMRSPKAARPLFCSYPRELIPPISTTISTGAQKSDLSVDGSCS